MNDAEARFLDRNSPYTLFLILILLILGSDKKLETYFESARNFVLGTKHSIESIRVGLEGMQTHLVSFQAQLLDLDKN